MHRACTYGNTWTFAEELGPATSTHKDALAVNAAEEGPPDDTVCDVCQYHGCQSCYLPWWCGPDGALYLLKSCWSAQYMRVLQMPGRARQRPAAPAARRPCPARSGWWPPRMAGPMTARRCARVSRTSFSACCCCLVGIHDTQHAPGCLLWVTGLHVCRPAVDMVQES
jgi:hypothetical protein